MTIRELQYAIQDAIDKGVPDDAELENAECNTPTLFAVEYDSKGEIVKTTQLCRGGIARDITEDDQ